ncbi:MAG: hypothetical protein HQL51_06245 [Magnetococcales bacterium]|nr:hypothetical protein [Magnetococcales bacterium]
MFHDVEPVILDKQRLDREPERHPGEGRNRGFGRGAPHGTPFDQLLRQALGDAITFTPPLSPPTPDHAPPRRTAGEDLWRQAAEQFDPRRATFQQLAELALRLYREGAVSVLEYLLLASSPEDESSVFGDVLFTPADAAGRCDWIAEFEARREAARHYDHYASIDAMERVLDNLKRVEAARGRSLAASA